MFILNAKKKVYFITPIECVIKRYILYLGIEPKFLTCKANVLTVIRTENHKCAMYPDWRNRTTDNTISSIKQLQSCALPTELNPDNPDVGPDNLEVVECLEEHPPQ